VAGQIRDAILEEDYTRVLSAMVELRWSVSTSPDDVPSCSSPGACDLGVEGTPAYEAPLEASAFEGVLSKEDARAISTRLPHAHALMDVRTMELLVRLLRVKNLRLRLETLWVHINLAASSLSVRAGT